MNTLFRWGWQSRADKLAIALAVSASVHAMALANLSFAPRGDNAGALAAFPPLVARIVQTPAEPVLAPKSIASRPAVREAAAAAGASAAPRAGIPATEVFYRASEVDERAVPLNDVQLEYPDSALKAGTSGSVTLRLLIGHDGSIRNIEVLASQPPRVFDQAAVKAVSALRFKPAVRNGVAVGSVKNIEVPFYPDCNRTGSCVGEQPAAPGR